MDPQNKLTPCNVTYITEMTSSRVLLEKLTVPQMVMKTPPTYYKMQRFTTTFTTATIFPILRQINPVHTLPTYLLMVHHIILPFMPSASK
jgi:hypothetical protein